MELSEPIQAHGETVTRLEFRKPTGKDIRTCGYPMRFDTARATEIAFVEDSMHRMIGALAAIPPSSVDQLSPGDWLNAAMVVSGFLAPAAPKSSTATTSTGAGGATSAT